MGAVVATAGGAGPGSGTAATTAGVKALAEVEGGDAVVAMMVLFTPN